MWDYTGKVKDHFQNPRNVGFIKDYDGIGEVGSLACGDALQLTFKLDGDKRISDVKFKTFGCASAIASSSALTELIKGKSLDEAENVTNRDIADFLGGLPEQKMHCSVMGREALEAAIEYYRTGGKRKKRELDSRGVCTCYGITEKEIQRVIRENGLKTPEEVTNYTKAGGGCGQCVGEIKSILAAANESAPSEEKPRKKKMTNLEKIRCIEETLETKVIPSLMEHGGSLELVDIEGDKVVVRFTGTCANCRVAEFTMQEVVEKKLREFVSPELVVEEEKS